MKKLLAILLLASSSAHGITGNELLASLEAKEPGLQLYGIGFVTAIADITRNTLQCSPAVSTYGQAKDVVIKYMKENPETRHAEAFYIVADALRKTWPCKGDL
jgi:hypothetical protein